MSRAVLRSWMPAGVTVTIRGRPSVVTVMCRPVGAGAANRAHPALGYRLEAPARSWKHTATSAAFLLRPLDTFLAPDPAKSQVNRTS
ncbi:hypothetical protein [Streptomyces sp. MBT62]|uniref:hypothetical protein n=1 Tax=Streptomyces sp. MBT62 TaxID=2800410 RepID=UPI00190D4E2D|nr:hypothetical protein [Streptomyces sp. MBT62]MBK3564192.1 hypothetical protein [Streptomyces sp. MBT62]